jgi:hypothetical protein
MAVPVTPTAAMGYVGFLQLQNWGLTTPQFPIRFTSSDLNITQDITAQDVIDGRVDRSVYQLGPIITEGTVGFPVIIDASGDFINNIWIAAVRRDNREATDFSGELIHFGDIVVKYVQGRTYTFRRSKINSLTLTATQGEPVTGSIMFWGTTRDASSTLTIPNYLTPARVLTWDQVRVYGFKGTTPPSDPRNSGTFSTQFVRSFSVTIDNALSRNYTFDPDASLFPSNISTGKRSVTGNLEFQGWAPTEDLADSNTQRCTSEETLRFEALSNCTLTGQDQNTSNTQVRFSRQMYGVIYRHQDVSSTMDVFTSTVAWQAYQIEDDNVDTIDGNQPHQALDVTSV